MANALADYLRHLDPLIEEFHPHCGITIPESLVDKYFPGINKVNGIEYTTPNKKRVVKIVLDSNNNKITLTGFAVDNTANVFNYTDLQGL